MVFGGESKVKTEYKDKINPKKSEKSKKMSKVLKNAPISMQEESEDNLVQLDWADDQRLKRAKAKLFSRLSKDDREKAHEWNYRYDRLVNSDAND